MNTYCASCGRDLNNVPKFKKSYFGFKIINKKVVENITPAQLRNQSYMNQLGLEGLINVTTITMDKPGNIYDYNVEENGSSYEFCNNSCACLYARKNDFVFLFQDPENEFKKRVLIPENQEANNALNNSSPFRSLFVDAMTAGFLLPTSVLTTDRLVIRDVEMSDVEGLWQIYGDEATMTKFDPEMSSQDLSREGLINTIRHFVDSNSYYWVITPKQKPEAILGFCYIVNKGFGVGIEFALNKDVRRRGVMTEALIDIFQYLKASGINELIAFSELGNIESKALFGKLGFQTTKAPVASSTGGVSMKYIHNGRL